MILPAINSRLGCKFAPRTLIEGEVYDCVTFIASVYHEAGIIPEIPEFPDYRVYGKGNEMRDLTCQIIDDTNSFSVDEKKVAHGDLLVFSEAGRGHHVAIFLEGNFIAHCVHRRGVVIDGYAPPISDSLFRIYRPKSI